MADDASPKRGARARHPFRDPDGGLNPPRCWKWIIAKVVEYNALSGTRPMVAIERINEFKRLFVNTVTGLVRELTEDEFVAVFDPLLKAQRFSEHELRQWFRDIDVDTSEKVSWDEFTSFMIYQASSFGEDNHRSREMVPNLVPPVPSSALHKDLVRRVCTHADCPHYVTAGFDGLIKLWEPSNVTCVRTVNNTEMSAARDLDVKGQLGVCPVADAVFNAKGSHLFACGADKSINAYDVSNLSVYRRFLGRWLINEHGKKMQRGGLVECTTLMEMQDTPMTLDVVSPRGKEVMFLGMQNGAIMAYPTSRNALIPQLRPHFSEQTHTDAVSKLRYLPAVDGIVSSSWDKTLCVTSPETGQVMTRLDGGHTGKENSREVVRHNKMAFDFDFNTTMRLLATVACEREVFLWNPNVSSPIAQLKGHATLLLSVAFDAVDRQLFSLDQDNTIKVWDLRMLRVCQTVNESTIHETGSFMRMSTLAYDDHTSTLIGASHRLSTWTVRRAFSHFPPTHIGHTESIVSIDHIRSTNTLLTADGNVVMSWDVKTGKRNVVFDPYPGEYGRIAAFGVDRNERRIIIASKSGDAKVFNFRNGQKLRDVNGRTKAEPIRVVQCSSRDATSKVFCVVAPTEANVYGEVPSGGGLLNPDPERVIKPKGKNNAFTCALEYPSESRSSCGWLVCGTSQGQIVVISALTGHQHSVSQHPMRPKTRHHLRREQRTRVTSRGEGRPPKDAAVFLTSAGAGGRSREKRLTRRVDASEEEPVPMSAGLFKLPVEDLVYLPLRDLFVSCLGDAALYFWDLRRNQCKLSYATGLQPEECILCVAADPLSNNFLVASDDNGVVYVRDISRLPSTRESVWDASAIVLLHVFRAHLSPITRLVVVSEASRIMTIVTLGADMFVKQSTFTGRLVGYMGQRAQWHASKPSTWGREPHGILHQDDIGTLPAPPTRAPTAQSRSAGTPLQPAGGTSFLTEAPALRVDDQRPTDRPKRASSPEAFQPVNVERLPSPVFGTRPSAVPSPAAADGPRSFFNPAVSPLPIPARCDTLSGTAPRPAASPSHANSVGLPVQSAVDYIRSGGGQVHDSSAAQRRMKPHLFMHHRIAGRSVPAHMVSDTLEAKPMTPGVVAEAEDDAEALPPPAKHPISIVRKFRVLPDGLRESLGGARSAPLAQSASESIGNLFRVKVLQGSAVERLEQDRTPGAKAGSGAKAIPYSDDSMSLDAPVSRAILTNPQGWTRRVATLQTLAHVTAPKDPYQPRK